MNDDPLIGRIESAERRIAQRDPLYVSAVGSPLTSSGNSTPAPGQREAQAHFAARAECVQRRAGVEMPERSANGAVGAGRTA